MRIGIMAAMPEEASLLADALSNKTTHKIANREYIEGKLGRHDIVLVFSRWGKVAASMTATTLIQKFNVEMVYFTGVAGAVAPELNIGDIVIAEALYQHDMDARPIFPKYHIPLTELSLMSTDAQLMSQGMQAAETTAKVINEKLSAEQKAQFFIQQPKVIKGCVASGDAFISDRRIHALLKHPDADLAAVEMEGAAVAQVCLEHELPFGVMRVISDKADGSANIDFVKFVQNVANQYSVLFIQDLLERV